MGAFREVQGEGDQPQLETSIPATILRLSEARSDLAEVSFPSKSSAEDCPDIVTTESNETQPPLGSASGPSPSPTPVFALSIPSPMRSMSTVSWSDTVVSPIPSGASVAASDAEKQAAPSVHCSCFKNVPSDCDFGVLRDIMLPPGCVSLPRTSLLVEQIIGMTRPQPDSLMGVQSLTDEFSSSGDSPEESGMERRSVKDKADRDFDDYVRVYDGLARYRKRQCRYLSLGRSVSVQKVIELSLKAFQLPPDEAKDYCLIELNEKDGSEHSLHTAASFKSQLQYETRRPQIILRFRERLADKEYIQVYPGAIGQYTDIDLLPVSVPITRDTTSHDVISLALRRFGLEVSIVVSDTVLTISKRLTGQSFIACP
ncbi:unnamed protein product [Echinostoma caproni]|uniref:Ras-associating domain-containing protein n=1 Tax=Echinostoma caproni TaxID=27848 RepID=A0A183AU19_9TREM|nr:unnamed protein product [Echinostoma caproni]